MRHYVIARNVPGRYGPRAFRRKQFAPQDSRDLSESRSETTPYTLLLGTCVVSSHETAIARDSVALAVAADGAHWKSLHPLIDSLALVVRKIGAKLDPHHGSTRCHSFSYPFFFCDLLIIARRRASNARSAVGQGPVLLCSGLVSR